MLVLSRKSQQSIVINDQITVTVLGVRGNQIRLGIDAPPQIAVRRRELGPPSAKPSRTACSRA